MRSTIIRVTTRETGGSLTSHRVDESRHFQTLTDLKIDVCVIGGAAELFTRARGVSYDKALLRFLNRPLRVQLSINFSQRASKGCS
jgi:hypothetical protein